MLMLLLLPDISSLPIKSSQWSQSYGGVVFFQTVPHDARAAFLSPLERNASIETPLPGGK